MENVRDLGLFIGISILGGAAVMAPFWFLLKCLEVAAAAGGTR